MKTRENAINNVPLILLYSLVAEPYFQCRSGWSLFKLIFNRPPVYLVSQCSGYHVCFTRRRSPVRSWPKPFLSFFVFTGMQELCSEERYVFRFYWGRTQLKTIISLQSKGTFRTSFSFSVWYRLSDAQLSQTHLLFDRARNFHKADEKVISGFSALGVSAISSRETMALIKKFVCQLYVPRMV